MYNSIEDVPFSDLSLNLIDDDSQLKLNVHKNILYMNSKYFQSLLSNNFKEKEQKEITLNVSDVNTAYDVIASWYGIKQNSGNYPEWKQQLETYLCKNYWGLETDLTFISDINVPIEGFELLLRVIDIIGYDANTLNCINRNLPEDYDLSLIDRKLLFELEKNNYWLVSGDGDNTIKIWDIKTMTLKYTLTGHNNWIISIAFSPD